MARPLYEAIERARKREAKQGQVDAIRPELDPLRRVHSETFLLQRTRRFARALEQLCERLRRPAHSLEGLTWRLHGPVGPLALAQAIMKEPREQRAAGEVAFLLAEIALALSRIQPPEALNALPPSDVRTELKQVIREIRDAAAPHLDKAPPGMSAYVKRAFREAMR